MMRPDTRLLIIDGNQHLIGGYATVRGYRDLHGQYSSAATTFMLPVGITPVFDAYTRRGKPQRSDVVGYVRSYRPDPAGLWCEFRLISHEQLWPTLSSGDLYFCAAPDSRLSRVNRQTGYFSLLALKWLTVTPLPTFRPSGWLTTAEYIIYLGEQGGELDYPAQENEETPLGEALPEGYGHGA